MKTRHKIIMIIAISFVGIFLLATSDSHFNRIIHDMYKSNSIKNYEMMETTCNRDNGELDGECFINAFDECKSARINQMGSTFDGDPIFYYAHVILSDPCTIHFAIDNSQDAWGGMAKGLHQKTCIDAQFDKHAINFQCDNEHRMIPLR